ncbi:MAG: hypothetical protein PHX83_02295 [Acidobacteriia bacterium]|nr:hypothetical protein [Terriglobia bacterium]
MKHWFQNWRAGFQLEHWLAEFIAVFFDRSQVGTALITANRLRGVSFLHRWRRK